MPLLYINITKFSKISLLKIDIVLSQKMGHLSIDPVKFQKFSQNLNEKPKKINKLNSKMFENFPLKY